MAKKQPPLMPVTYMMRHSILTQDSQKWPTWDGKTVHRSSVLTSSEATGCVRMLAFNKRKERQKLREAKGTNSVTYWGEKDSDELRRALEAIGDGPEGIFARGHNVEAWLVGQLKGYADQSETISVMHTGNDQVSFNVMASRLSGTPDGLMVDEGDYKMHLLEVKSSNRWMMSQPSFPHRHQVLQNIAIIKRIADKVGHYEFYKMMGWDNYFEFQGDSLPEFSSGQIIYINPANYLETVEHTIPFDDFTAYDAARVKAKLLFPRDEETGKRRLEKPENLAAQGLTRPGGCTFCDHKSKCAAIEKANGRKYENFDVVDLEDDGDFPKIEARASVQEKEAQLLTRFSKAKALESAGKKEAEKLKGDVKALFAAHGIEEGQSAVLDLEFTDLQAYGNFKVRRTVSTRKGGVDDEWLESVLHTAGFKGLDDFRKEPTITESISVTSTD